MTPTVTAGRVASTGTSTPGGDDPNDGINPFDDPGEDLTDFPLPDELPPGAGTCAAPKAEPWSVAHFDGQMACGDLTLPLR